MKMEFNAIPIISRFVIETQFDSSSNSEDDKEIIETLALSLSDRKEIPRIENYIAYTVLRMSDKTFKSHFRIDRSTADYLVDLLAIDLSRVPGSVGRCPIPVYTQILMSLWMMATPDTYSIRNNRNVFSVMGRNGSGKSTIVSALVLGLGGRASSTFRGKKIQEFIKRGSTTATIKIQIKNTNPKAYKHDVYGDSITIVRTITASGGSYKILSHSGKLISSKKTDVDAIVLYHDIQVENPISVLNQDEARSFYGVRAEDKYASFRRAANFAQTEEYYNRAHENCQKTKVILARKNEAFRDSSKEYNQIKNEYDQMKTKEEIENEKRHLLTELEWLDVENLEREVKNRSEECERRRTACRKTAEDLSAIKEEHANNTDALESLRRSAAEPEARRRELELERREAGDDAGRAGELLRSDRERRDRLRTRLDGKRKQTADLSEAIRNVESGRDDGGGRPEELERESSRARAAADETSARRDTARHDEQQAGLHAARAAGEADRAVAELKADEKQLGRARGELRELRQHAAASLAVFGASMVRLCELVGRAVREGRFSAPPRGPVGNYLKVKSREWASALEHVIGGSMNHFCVNSAKDSRLLFDIMSEVYPRGNRAGGKPGVTCSEFRARRHDVDHRRVAAPGGTCALDALEITDHVVANYLIDNLELETILLVADHDVAVRLASSARCVPANCSRLVTRDCTVYMPAPRYRFYGGEERPPRYLGTSARDRTGQIEAKIVELEASVAEKTSEAAHLARQKETARRAHERASRALLALQDALRKEERLARDAAEELQRHAAPQLTELREEYELQVAKVAKLEEEMRELNENEQILEEKKRKADERLLKVQKEFEAVNGQYRRIQEEADLKQQNLERSAAERKRCDQHARADTDRLKRAEDELERAQKTLSDRREGLGPRPERSRERGEVQSQLRLLERRQGSARDAAARRRLRERLDDVTARRSRVRLELDRVRDLVDKIDRLTDKHSKRSYDQQMDIERHVGLTFTKIMSQRNYAGRLELDHVCKKLDLYIAEKNVNLLSGGERSYSTVALFMAMWKCVELPFYFMDEFDVFMDERNRTAIWRMLVEFAKERRGRLFVFLTQKSLPIDDDEIEIIRLESAV